MRSFDMFRGEDESGVSGTGKVLEGFIFSSGVCYVAWVTELRARSETRYNSFTDFANTHIISHEGNKTKVVFSDGEVYEQVPKTELSKTKRRRKAKVPEVAPSVVGESAVGQSYTGGRPTEVSHIESKEK